MTAILCGRRVYEVTPEDRLWLLRAVHAEGRVERQVAQTLINLFACLYSGPRGRNRTLTELVRS